MTTPRPRRSAVEQSVLEDSFREPFERTIAFNQSIGMRIESLDAESPKIRFDVRPELVGHHLTGRLHGGVISAALDVTEGRNCAPRQAATQPSRTARRRFGSKGLDIAVTSRALRRDPSIASTCPERMIAGVGWPCSALTASIKPTPSLPPGNP